MTDPIAADLAAIDDDPSVIWPDDLAAVGIDLAHVGSYSDDDGNAGSVLHVKGRDVAFYDDGADGWIWVSLTPAGAKITDGWSADKGNLLYMLARHARRYGYPA